MAILERPSNLSPHQLRVLSSEQVHAEGSVVALARAEVEVGREMAHPDVTLVWHVIEVRVFLWRGEGLEEVRGEQKRADNVNRARRSPIMVHQFPVFS